MPKIVIYWEDPPSYNYEEVDAESALRDHRRLVDISESDLEIIKKIFEAYQTVQDKLKELVGEGEKHA